MSITLTERAANRMYRSLLDRQYGLGIRVAVKTTGCSGLAYIVEFADFITPDDIVFDDNLIKIIVDYNSLPIVDGSEIDYVKEGLNEGFKFINPNVREECGCGESFTV